MAAAAPAAASLAAAPARHPAPQPAPQAGCYMDARTEHVPAGPPPEAHGGGLRLGRPRALLGRREEHPLAQAVLLQAPDVGAGVALVRGDHVGPVALPHLRGVGEGRGRRGEWGQVGSRCGASWLAQAAGRRGGRAKRPSPGTACTAGTAQQQAQHSAARTSHASSAATGASFSSCSSILSRLARRCVWCWLISRDWASWMVEKARKARSWPAGGQGKPGREGSGRAGWSRAGDTQQLVGRGARLEGAARGCWACRRAGVPQSV